MTPDPTPSAPELKLSQLRARFLALARRRVGAEAAEDVVQEAMIIVHEKCNGRSTGDRVDGVPLLAWCLQVLRNVIGNYYQRERTRSRASRADGDLYPKVVEFTSGTPSPTPIEALERRELGRRLRDAIDAIPDESARCRKYLRRLLEGAEPGELALEEGVTQSAFYNRLHRCRQKLRMMLEESGVVL
jgi:RNA polymerase sigma factor (sigma-70 family)